MEEIARELAAAVQRRFRIECEPEIVLAPENAVTTEGVTADYASNVALRLAKELQRAPIEIAEEIAKEMDGGGGVNDSEGLGEAGGSSSRVCHL